MNTACNCNEYYAIAIGAGASGYGSAIAFGQKYITQDTANKTFLILESGKKAARSIMAAGNGRCNLTNADLSPLHYNNPRFAEAVMGEHATEAVTGFFSNLGLWMVEEAEGRMYPASRAASSVRDVLNNELDRLGIQVKCEQEVYNVERKKGKYVVHVRAGDGKKSQFVCTKLLWAAGGTSQNILAEAFNLSLVPTQPVLTALATQERNVSQLDNVRSKAKITLTSPNTGSVVSSEEGEVLFRKYGVSGIAVFNLSRFAKPKMKLHINLAPHISTQALQSMLDARTQLTSVPRSDFLSGALHPTLARFIMNMHDATTGKRNINTQLLTSLISDFTLTVKGPADITHAQVMRGGISVEEVDPLTMECIHEPGLYIVGEALDIDGDCGGRNLSFAWCSGMRAGNSL